MAVGQDCHSSKRAFASHLKIDSNNRVDPNLDTCPDVLYGSVEPIPVGYRESLISHSRRGLCEVFWASYAIVGRVGACDIQVGEGHQESIGYISQASSGI